jgi:hypothetical protein
MRHLLIFLIFLSISQLANADDFCNDLALVAEQFMMHRQNGIPMENLMSSMKKDVDEYEESKLYLIRTNLHL